MNESKSKLLRYVAHAKRLSWGKVGFYKTVGQLINDLTIGDYLNDPAFLDSGSEQLVFKTENGESVDKLVIETVGSSRSVAEACARHYQKISDAAQKHLSEFWVDTEFRPISLPTRLGRHAVAAAQPLIPIVANFDGPQEMYTYQNDNPGYVQQQEELLDRIGSFYRATEMLPDLLGSGNIVTMANPSGGELLRVIDTIPETPHKLALPSEFPSMTRLDVHKIVIGSWLSHLEDIKQVRLA
jgi:hypothetical protein